MCAATMTAFSPEEQKRLTVPPGTVTGSPARRPTLRPVLNPWGPSGKPVPMITSSISAGSSWGTLRGTSLMQCAALSSGRVRLNEPRNDLASPVRELATITASRMRDLLGMVISAVLSQESTFVASWGAVDGSAAIYEGTAL